MADPRVEKLAKLLVNYSTEVKPGDKVVLSGSLATRPLMIATYKEIVRAGGHPTVMWNDSTMREFMLKKAMTINSPISPPPCNSCTKPTMSLLA